MLQRVTPAGERPPAARRRLRIQRTELALRAQGRHQVGSAHSRARRAYWLDLDSWLSCFFSSQNLYGTGRIARHQLGHPQAKRLFGSTCGSCRLTADWAIGTYCSGTRPTLGTAAGLEPVGASQSTVVWRQDSAQPSLFAAPSVCLEVSRVPDHLSRAPPREAVQRRCFEFMVCGHA